MENLPGGDVLHYIERRSLFKESDAAALVRQLVAALAHCQAHGVVHRDVKPANMLMSSDNMDDHPVIKLCDFGSSCFWSPPTAFDDAPPATAAGAGAGAGATSTIANEVASKHMRLSAPCDGLNAKGLMVGEHGSPFYGAPEVHNKKHQRVSHAYPFACGAAHYWSKTKAKERA